MPGDNLAAKEVDGTNQDSDGTHFTEGASNVAEEHVDKRGEVDVSAFFKESQRSRTADGIGGHGEPFADGGPCGHLYGEGDEQEYTTDEGGVEGILAETAETHFTHTNGY